MLERKSYFYVVIAGDKILLTVNKEQSELSEASNGLLTARLAFLSPCWFLSVLFYVCVCVHMFVFDKTHRFFIYYIQSGL